MRADLKVRTNGRAWFALGMGLPGKRNGGPEVRRFVPSRRAAALETEPRYVLPRAAALKFEPRYEISWT